MWVFRGVGVESTRSAEVAPALRDDSHDGRLLPVPDAVGITGRIADHGHALVPLDVPIAPGEVRAVIVAHVHPAATHRRGAAGTGVPGSGGRPGHLPVAVRYGGPTGGVTV